MKQSFLRLATACVVACLAWPATAADAAPAVPLDPVFPPQANIPAEGTLVTFGNNTVYLLYRYQKLQIVDSRVFSGCGLQMSSVYPVTNAASTFADGAPITDAATCQTLVKAAQTVPPANGCDLLAYWQGQAAVAHAIYPAFHNKNSIKALLKQIIINAGQQVTKTAAGCSPATRLANGELPASIVASGVAAGALNGLPYQGGLIATVNPDGSGIVAAAQDYPKTAFWQNMPNAFSVTGATQQGIGTGKANTLQIVNALGAPKQQWQTYNYAAYIPTAGYTSGGYADWYLPSLNELQAVLKNVLTLAACTTANSSSADIGGGYWSSTESNGTAAFYVSCWDYQPGPPPTQCSTWFSSPNPPCDTPKSAGLNIRMTRAFPAANPTLLTSAPVLRSCNATVYSVFPQTSGAAISDRGIIWDAQPSPDLFRGTVVSAGSGGGSAFSIKIPTGSLNPEGTYYVRAYAKMTDGTVVYGNQVQFMP